MGMALDESTEGLEQLNSNGINAWIDPQLKTYLLQMGDINIDYVTNEYGSGYMVTVGESKCGQGGCSCDTPNSSK
jgi:Fe-S cluster assembly iron-binding protein IscA